MGRIILPPLVCLPRFIGKNYRKELSERSLPTPEHPLEGTERIPAGVAARGLYRTKGNGSPVFRHTVARDEILWSREDEGAISHC